MCGIYGFSGVKNDRLLLNMKKSMFHRGPDNYGFFTNDKFNLGHLRLSVIDLSEESKQPIFNEDRSLVLVFNGEIYNYRELRSKLKIKGHTFVSEGDSEVILHGYEEWGKGVLSKIRGIFAFAIYNVKKDEVFLARDHFGIKPLYFSYDNANNFAFASELKSLLSCDWIDKQIDYNAVQDYLTFLWAPAPKTMLRDINKLEPGEYLVVKEGKVKERVKYFHKNFKSLEKHIAADDAIDELDELFKASVKEQLASDVPLGLFLSGGLDSSLIAAYVRYLKPNEPLKAFTIDIQEDDLDGSVNDLPYAIEVAKLLNIDLEIIKVSSDDILRHVEDLVYLLDEPTADPAAINLMLITKVAKDLGYTVLLGGTGGDDIFSGYRRHKAIVTDEYIFKIPKALRELISKIIKPIASANPKLRRLKKYSYGIGDDFNTRIIKYFNWLPKEQIQKLLSPKLLEQSSGYCSNTFLLNKYDKEWKGEGNLNKMLTIDFNHFLTDHNLNYTDKMGMVNSIEARVPFLDIRLVSYVDGLPEKMKFKDGEGKWILKKLAERYLPKSIIYRQKTGFGVPLRKWIANDLQPLFETYLNKQTIQKFGLFDASEVQKLFELNRSSKIDASYTLLSLLYIHIWLVKFGVKEL